MRLRTAGSRIGVRPSAVREGGESRREDITPVMARPEGFEPPTNGFGSRYSIQLSYGRLVRRRGASAGPSGWRAGAAAA